MDKLKILGALIFFLNAPFSLFGQLPGDVSSQIEKLVPKPAQQSPNAAAIQKYGDFNVNLYTGIPDISIPIFEIQSGGITVPIVLSYHAGGIRYTDRASWAGLGWSVQVGGQITRTIQGKPDEDSFLSGTNNYSVDTYDYCNNFYYKEHTANGSNDREPDLFSYSFPGASGRFVLRQGGLPPLLFPESAIQVTRNPNYYDITDTKGLMYRFGSDWAGANAARESMSAYSGSTVTSGVVTWYLQEIKSPNTDDYVTFKYQDVGSFIINEIESNISLMDNCTTSESVVLPCTSYSPVETLVSTSNSSTQMGIDEIFFNTGKVKFIMGANRTDVPGGSSMKRLSKIEVYSKVNNAYVLLKSFTLLNSGNFKLAVNNSDARLKLDGLEVRDGSNTLINKYGFTYNTTTFSWDQSEGSFRRDLFGFYNGKTTNTNLIPKDTVQYRAQSFHTPIDLVIGGADRSTDTTYYKEGLLKQITFPTGGYTEFQFEPHKYLEGAATKYGAGLRIKKILKNDGVTSYSTLYKYGAGESGFGHKNFDVRNFHFMNTLYKRDIYSSFQPIPQRQYNVRTWVSNSVVGPGFDDAPVVYTNVMEYANSTNGNGKTLYEFDNNLLISDGVFAVPHSNKIWRNRKSWQRGKLTKVIKYDNLNNIKEVTSKTYTQYKSQTPKVGQAAFQVIVGQESENFFTICSGYDGQRYMIVNMDQDVGVFQETSTKVTSFFGADSVQHITNRGYHATYLQPTFEEVISSGNPGTVRTNFRYNYDIVGTGTTYTGLPDAYKQMLLKNMISSPVEQYTWVKEGAGANEVVSGQVTEFSLVSGTSLYVPSSVYFFETASPVTNYSPLVVSGTSALSKDTRYKLRMSMQGYDVRGNLIQYALTNGATSSFIYGYDGKYLIAEATNSSVGNIAFTSFETNEKGGWTYAGAESPVMAGQAKTGNNVYLLNNGQVSKSVTGTYKLSFWARKNSASAATLTINGTAYSGTLDDTWRLVEVTGSASVTISGSGTIIDELRVHPSNSLMTTYTIKPQIGMWSMVDSKNLGIYYQYDPFGRLETVKNEDGHILKHYEYTYIKP
ncbi:hypothetical protein [Algoriphagus sp. A40]|uniref:hypothetical protein n=1 Tax=Algoriphagus sp. A40 TaxID=1945863 RepID=UPI00098784BA|nr:hypothetical protein [Algoriphagus sp. A40]OOG76431.1 hypothetical protein B0E43_08040 [Algoriphagus sp. A40]